MSATNQYPVVPASVSFHQNTLITAEVNGIQYAAMKPIVEGMGIDWRGQQAKIRSSKRYGDITLPMQTTSGIQEMVCMPLTKLNGWLFSVNSAKVKPEIREKIRQYQEECFVVLHDYWHGGAAINENARIESGQADPARLAESLMQALIASLSGKHNDKIDDLGCEIVSRLQVLSDQFSVMPGREDLLPALEILNASVGGLKRHLVTMLPKLAVPDDLVRELRVAAQSLNALADQQDAREFAFHERLRALEMKYRGVDLNQTTRLIGSTPGVQDYIEGNVPESLRRTFNMMRVPKAAGGAYLLKFMKECLIPDPESRIETQRLYSVYCAWCFSNMSSPLRNLTFRQMLKDFLPLLDFKGTSVKSEHYVHYLFGTKVRIPQENSPAPAVKPELPAETAAETRPETIAETIAAEPAEAPIKTSAEPKPRRFADFADRIFGGKGGE